MHVPLQRITLITVTGTADSGKVWEAVQNKNEARPAVRRTLVAIRHDDRVGDVSVMVRLVLSDVVR